MASSQSRIERGLWTNPKVTQYSKETQDMLSVMMQEYRLTSTQRKVINECIKNGEALPLSFGQTLSAPNSQPKTSKPGPRSLPWRPQRRSAESCRFGNSYVREKFCPGPIRDLEKEKRRLQNILETGKEELTSSTNVPACRKPGGVEDIDRYQEVLNEIEERRQFLADMAALGQEKCYINIINTEISQKIQELKMLDESCSPEKTTASGREVMMDEQTKDIFFKKTGEK